ncbi:MAG TPA: serine hydrolase domain-containing protein [Longimicrobium sp.]|nr:serine hydrolase domain-containing protein [Longimicrobium sp.]
MQQSRCVRTRLVACVAAGSIALAGCVSAGVGQASAPAATDPVVIPPVERIDSIFARFSAPGSPGCVLTVMRAGDIVLSRAYGVANRETGEPLSTRSVIDAGSLTKQFTAYAIALLAAEGRLSLDDDVRRHIPELPAYPHTITLRHLLNQASGLREYTEIRTLAANGLDGTQLLLRANGLSFRPGDQYLYSNTGFHLLGWVVERVSGQPLATFLHERLFRPLGMIHTRLPVDSARTAERAHAYTRGDTGWVHQLPPPEPGQGDMGLLTTPEDLAKWDRNFYEPRIGGGAVQAILRDSLRLNGGGLSTYSFGLHREPYRGVRRDWHGGQAFGFRSQWWRFPDRRISFLTACNTRTAEPGGLTERVADLFLAEDFAAAGHPVRAEARIDSAAAAPYFGFYVGRAAHQPRFVQWRDGRFAVRYVATFYDLVPVAPGRFRVRGQPLELAFTPAPGGGMRLEEHGYGAAAPVVYERPGPAEPRPPLSDYAGVYRSAELGTEWRLEPRGEAIRAALPRDTTELRYAGRDAYSDGYVLVLFRRDGAGRVVGFDASTPRLLGVAFTRER